MCGIAGIFSKSKIDSSKLMAMCNVIKHRGPDGEGAWFNADSNLALGHRRLSIIDLSDNAKQPMQYANGWIYPKIAASLG